MKASVFLLLVVAFVGVQNAPQKLQAPDTHLVSHHGIKAKNAPRDWLSDLIAIITGNDIIHFLEGINTSLTDLETLVNRADGQLQEIMEGTTPSAKEQIEAVVNEALRAAIPIIQPVLYELGLVLPVITRRKVTEPGDVSLIIGIIIGKDLEDFLHCIGVAYSELDGLIAETLNRLYQVASIVASGCAERIMAVTDETLTEAWRVIQPYLDVLELIFPALRHERTRAIKSTSV